MGIHNFFESKVLALSVLILLLSTLVSTICSLLPWWFRLHFGTEDATYGSMGAQEADLDIGVFWIYKPNKPGPERNFVLMTSLLALDRASNLPVVPPMFRIAQVFYMIGLFGVMIGFGGAMLLALRQLGSQTGTFGLSIMTILSSIGQVIAVVFLFVTTMTENEWHMLPLEDPYRIVITSHPTMYINWAFYIAVIGAALSLFGAILLHIAALRLNSSISEIRLQQRRHKPPVEPYPDIRYTRFSYADVPRPKPQYTTHHGGVVLNRPPPQQQFFAQPQPSPQQPQAYSPQQTYPQAPRYGGEFQPSPDTSREYISRQVDL